MQLTESIDNKLAIEALKDIAYEERVHAGGAFLPDVGRRTDVFARFSTVGREGFAD